uniref:Serine--tRNA ligase n=1 Tax=Candidatus Aschnera chinzeii TaxID=1485666 RepID=A0AAT9G413_9ENTR|nr:MAG: serine--tRNA ligase [Candidatus Aschnera chinzeii]
MINPKLLRSNLITTAKILAHRGFTLDTIKLCDLEKQRKSLQIKTETLQSQRKYYSKIIRELKINNKDTTILLSEANKVNQNLSIIKKQLLELEKKIFNYTSYIPNLPDESVPKGTDERNNIEVSRWGKPFIYDFVIKDHIDLGHLTNGLDFSSAVKIVGARFVVMRNNIAKLHRALMNFMLDLHTEEHGYKEIYVPYIANKDSLYGSGQLPKFSDELFYVHSTINLNKDYGLIPTAEVSLINLLKNCILKSNQLPLKLTAYSPCFRSEAGSYGADTRGLIRMHQFDKIELVQVVEPEKSMDALEELTKHAEKVLQLLKLPYRKMLLCTGDIGFAACKTYDLEVWFPGQKTYREISSCSNTSDFQSRRIQARFRYGNSKKLYLLHMLNGSALAIGRTLAAVMENYQQSDGKILIPNVLKPYMNWLEFIE